MDKKAIDSTIQSFFARETMFDGIQSKFASENVFIFHSFIEEKWILVWKNKLNSFTLNYKNMRNLWFTILQKSSLSQPYNKLKSKKLILLIIFAHIVRLNQINFVNYLKENFATN